MPTVTSQKKNQPHNQKYVTLLQEKLHRGRYNGLGCWFSIPDLRFVMLKKKKPNKAVLNVWLCTVGVGTIARPC